MAIELERRPGHVVAHASLLFARDDARAVRALLEDDSRTRVTLDLQETRGSEPIALAVLADVIRELPARIEVVGLCWDQRRLLAYFGIPDLRADGDAEESAEDE